MYIVPFVYLVSGHLLSLFGSDGFLERISRFLLLMDFSKGHLHLICSLTPLESQVTMLNVHSISPENPKLNDDHEMIFHISTL